MSAMTDTWPTDEHGKPIPRPVVYQLDTGWRERDAVLRTNPWRERFLGFLYAHGIRYGHFIMGNSLKVRVHEGDTLWVHTWQAVEGRPMCEHCPGCIRQERVVVPLAAPVPDIPGRFICDGWLHRLTNVPAQVP